MKIDGINLVQGSDIQNMVVDSGPEFPSLPDIGELFFKTQGVDTGLFFHNGQNWIKIAYSPINLGTDTVGNYVGKIVAGNGIELEGAEGEGVTFTIKHASTSTQQSVNNSGNTFIQDVTLDSFGHITGLTSSTVSIGDGTLTVTAGAGLEGGGQLGTANQSTNTSVILSHADTSTVSNLSSDNGGNTFIQDISLTFDTYGHVTGASVATGTVAQANAFGRVQVDNTDTEYTWVSTDGTQIIADSTSDTMKVVSGSGIEVAADSGNDAIRISHADTSSAANLSSNNSGNTFIQDISLTFDTYGHVTGASVTAVEVTPPDTFRNISIDNTDSEYTWSAVDGTTVLAQYVDDTVRFVAGGGIDLFADTGNSAIKIQHEDTSSVSSINTSGTNATVLNGIALSFDTYGHVTGASATTVDLDSRFVNVTGDTMTGNLNFNTTGTGVTWAMNTDSAYIKFFNTGDLDTNSRLEYATGDNSDEYHRWLISGVEKMTLKQDALRVENNLIIGGNLTINGTTTTVNSTTVTIDDPILTLGGDVPLALDDSKDKGIEFRWHDGTSAKTGFFGFDRSTQHLTFIPNATNTNEVFSGAVGIIDANISWTFVTDKPDPTVTVTLSGDVAGSGNATLTDLGNGSISIATTIQPNSVALGTDTTGNYAGSVAAGSGISVSGTAGEGTTFTVSHADTSSVANLTSDNSGNVFIQDIAFTFDTYGHVTGASVGVGTVNPQNAFSYVSIDNTDTEYTWTAVDGSTIAADSSTDTFKIVAGTGIDVAADVSGDAIKISHEDTSSVVSFNSNNSNAVVIQDIAFTFDTFGHVTGATVGTVDLDPRFVNVDGDTMTGDLTVQGQFFTTSPAFGGFPLAPNMIHNTYFNRFDASNVPYGWIGNGVTLQVVHPFTHAFEGPYVSTSPTGAVTDPSLATQSAPYWFGEYNKGPRIQRGGLADGWHSLSDGKILKVTATGRVVNSNQCYISMPMEKNNLGAKWLFFCWVKLVKGQEFGAGTDAGYLSSARSNIVTKTVADQSPQGWYRYAILASTSQITSLDNLAFSLGFTPDANGEVEAYIALPYMANVNYKGTNLDAWTGSTLDKLMREGVFINPLTQNVGIGAEATDAKLSVNGNMVLDTLNTVAGSGISITKNSSVTISHAATSSQTSVDNSGNTFIQDIEVDSFGHITAIRSSSTSIGNGAFSVITGSGLTGGGQLGTANQSSSTSLTLSHADTSSVSNLAINNIGGTFIQDITLTFDEFGHVTTASVDTAEVKAFMSIAIDNTDTEYTWVSTDGTLITADTLSSTFKVVAGGGIDVAADATNDAIRISHEDTSSVANLAISNSGGNVLQSLNFTFDTYGHVTGATASSVNISTFSKLKIDNTDTEYTWVTTDGTQIVADSVSDTATFVAGGAIQLAADATTDSIKISHADTSSQGSVNNSGFAFIQDVTLDTYGHVTGLASGSVAFDLSTEPGDNIYSEKIRLSSSGSTVATDDIILAVGAVDTVYGLTIEEAGDTITFKHADTSSVTNVSSDNSGGTFIQDISLTFDTYGHVTGASVATANILMFTNAIIDNTDTEYTWVTTDGTVIAADSATDSLTFVAGPGIDLAADTTNDAIRISHEDTSSQSSVNNSNGVVIQDISLDTFGHITSLGSVDLDQRYARRDYRTYGILTAGNWYTIAVNASSRASGKFTLNDQTSSAHQSIHFYASHFYGQGNAITILHSDYYSTSPFRYLRIKEGSTYDGAMLQVYIDSSTSAGIYALYENDQSTGWSLVNPTLDGTNPGTVANFAALTNVAVQVDIDQGGRGAINTTGNLYVGGDITQYLVAHADNIKEGSGIDISGISQNGSNGPLFTISHEDTSSQPSVDNSGITFIQDVTLDGFGHITGLGSATLNLSTEPGADAYSEKIRLSSDTSGTVDDIILAVGSIDAVYGLTIEEAGDTITLKHADTSSVANLTSDNSGSTLIQDISFTFDTYGHVTGASVGTVDVYIFKNVQIDNTDTEYTWVTTDGTQVVADSVADTLKIVAGGAIDVAADATNDAIRISHEDTSSVANLSSDNAGITFIQDIALTFDTYGHVTAATTGVATLNLSTEPGADAYSEKIRLSSNTSGTTDDIILAVGAVDAVYGLTIEEAGDTITFKHADTSSVSNISSDNSGITFIQDTSFTFDTYGHVTAASVATATLNLSTEPGADAYSEKIRLSSTTSGAVDDIILAVGAVDTVYGLTIEETGDTITFKHADTSAVANVSSDNSGITFIQDASFTFDTYGHVTAASVATATLNLSTEPGADAYSEKIRLSSNTSGTTDDIILAVGSVDAVYGLTIEETGDTITFKHADTSSQASVNNSNLTVIQDVLLDTYGHTTGLTSLDLRPTFVSITGFQSQSDFINGTLVTTTIDASVTAGDSFIMEITGKSYSSSNAPFKVILQGYIYNNTFISASAISYGGTFAPYIRILEQNGKLCFWWARITYWNSFEVTVKQVSVQTDLPVNTVVSITDVVEPAATKTITVTPQSNYSFGNIQIDNTDTEYTWVTTDGTQISADSISDVVKIVAGGGIDVAADATNDAIRISHEDTSAVANLSSDNSGITFIQDIALTFDTYGHVTAASSGIATLNLSTEPGADAYSEKIRLSSTTSGAVDDIILAVGSVDAVYGLTIEETGDTITFKHADTSSVANLSSDNSGNTFIQDISFTFDTYGHVTGASVLAGTVVESNAFSIVQIDNTDTEYTWVTTDGTQVIADAVTDTLKIVAGGGIDVAADATNDAIRISHEDTSSQASVNNSGNTVIQDVTLDTYGHITGLVSATITDVNRLISSDDRIKAPADDPAYRLTFGFTSWANNNTSPYADYLHLRGYSDSTGGKDNLLMFRKDAIGLRLWQQDFGSTTAYATYKDVAFTTDLPAVGDGSFTVTAGSGLTGGGLLGTANQSSNTSITISHADTSSQASVSNSGNTFIQDITLDTYGHITAITSATASFTDTNTTYSLDGSSVAGGATIDLIAGGSGSGTDSISIVGAGATTITWDEATQKITISSTDSVTPGDGNTTYSISTEPGADAYSEKIRLTAAAPASTDDIILAVGAVDTVYGLTIEETGDTITFKHADTSSAANVSVNNSGITFIQDVAVTLDTYGHVTAASASSATLNLSTEPGADAYSEKIRLSSDTSGAVDDIILAVGAVDAVYGLTIEETGDTITFKHADTSSQASVSNTSGTVIQSIGLDTYGHVTSMSSIDLDTRYVNVTGDTMTGFLTLHADPTSNMHAVTKQYVDNLVANSSASSTTSIPSTPSTGIIPIGGVTYVNFDGDLKYVYPWNTTQQTRTFSNILNNVRSGTPTGTLITNSTISTPAAGATTVYLGVGEATINAANWAAESGSLRPIYIYGSRLEIVNAAPVYGGKDNTLQGYMSYTRFDGYPLAVLNYGVWRFLGNTMNGGGGTSNEAMALIRIA